jgi:hypothetical protein
MIGNADVIVLEPTLPCGNGILNPAQVLILQELSHRWTPHDKTGFRGQITIGRAE